MNYLISLLVSLLTIQTDFIQGLRFKDNTQPIDLRTSYTVFTEEEIECSKEFNLAFDLSIYSTNQIGYIFRIKDDQSNKIYNLFFEKIGGDLVFKFNEEGVRSLVTARVDENALFDSKWIDIAARFDLQNQTISLVIHDQEFDLQNIDIPIPYKPNVIFGKSDYIIDVPSFSIKALSIKADKKETYYFGLNESRGNDVHDENGNTIGTVSNPEWLINDAYFWRLRKTLSSRSVAGATNAPSHNVIYYFNKDTLYAYNTRTDQLLTHITKNECPIRLTVGMSFIDTLNNKLYAYEVYFDADVEGSTVASLDLDTFEWQIESDDRLPTQRHHHGHFYDYPNNQYFIFGGFGNKRYSNDFYQYDVTTNHWKRVYNDLNGDFIAPRYFQSVGYSETEQAVYIFGGMGNQSGDQVVGRKYMYDLHKLDLKTRTVKKLWEINWDKEDMVPVRSMVLTDSSFYTLVYPEHYTDSHLKLYQFSLGDGTYKILGDSIPIHSDKINTNANLYYNESQKSLYALVHEFEDDIASDLKIYSIAFPSITAKELLSHSRINSPARLQRNFVYTLIGILVISVIIYLLAKARAMGRKDRLELAEKLRSSKIEVKPNSIFLFGNFTVYNNKSKDVSYMFSAKLTEMFCIILQHSLNGGITSKKLSNLLWPDKEGEKLKNSRGVTINNLRKALNELEGIDLVYENGSYQITQKPHLYCDYIELMKILEESGIDGNKTEFIEIVSRGKFLSHLNEPIYDSFKITVERKLEPFMTMEIERCFNSGRYHSAILLSNALFHIDPLNDIALEFQLKSLQNLDRKEEALIKYNEFLIRYKDMMKQDYPKHYKI